MNASFFQCSLSSLHKDLMHLVVLPEEGNLLETSLAAKAVDDSIPAYAAASLVRAYGKKFVGESPFTHPLGQREEAALAEFVRCNTRCTEVRDYSACPSIVHAREILLDFLQGTGLDQLMFSELADTLTHGPGSSVGVKFTDFVRKTSFSTLTGTDRFVLTLYRHLAARFNLWGRAEARRSELFGERVEEHSLLGFAPKAFDRERVRMTESSANMALQLALAGRLNDGLRRYFGISPETEPDNNRFMAYLGSCDGSYTDYCTIDLKSASDLISEDLVRFLFRGTALLDVMDRIRSKTTKLPDGSVVRLKMWSTMGNGFTFPLQTLIFTALVIASYVATGTRVRDKHGVRRFGVHGDDMVVVKRAFLHVVETLTACGFEVNTDKSFSDGAFRESCGTDWYRGTNVRGVYIKRLQCRAEVVSAINRLNAWSAKHQIPLPRTVSTLISFLRGSERNVVPMWADATSGVRCPLSFAEYSGRMVHVSQTLRLKLGAMHGTHVCELYENLPKRVAIVKRRRANSSNCEVSAYWEQNIPGLLNAFVAGYIREGSMTVRRTYGSEAPSKTRLIAAPGWDYDEAGDKLSQTCQGQGAYWIRSYFLNLADLVG